jgi:signal transduction histidine kinase
LNAILGYTDLLLDGAMGEVQREQHEVLQRMRDRGLDLLNLIQATLDANRLETGRVMVHLTKLSLGEIVDRLREQIPERWLNPSVALRFSVQAPEAQLWTDEPKLLTILRNLVHNGLKFTQKGEVRVSVARDGEGVLFEVRDTGCGIERDQEARIFEIFGQADGRSSQEGVGLGLYICQRLAILLGGEIGVQSSPGLGSTFRVRLPQQPPQHLSSDV